MCLLIRHLLTFTPGAKDLNQHTFPLFPSWFLPLEARDNYYVHHQREAQWYRPVWIRQLVFPDCTSLLPVGSTMYLTLRNCHQVVKADENFGRSTRANFSPPKQTFTPTYFFSISKLISLILSLQYIKWKAFLSLTSIWKSSHMSVERYFLLYYRRKD